MNGSLLAHLAPHLRAGNDAPAQRFQADGQWRRRSYGELLDATMRVAATLRELGVERDDRIAILAPTRADWSVVDLAAAALGAPSVPIYPTSAPAQILEIVERSTPSVLVTVPGAVLPALPTTVRIVRLGVVDGDLGDLAGEALDDGERAALAAAALDVPADSLYSIAFSSGSTGVPKGCELSHANYVAVLEMVAQVELDGADAPAHRELAFVFLPLAHASARLQQLTTFAMGGELAYGSGGTGEILAQVAALEPTYVPGVPRLFESAYVRAGRDPERLRAMFGGRLHYALTGGAPIDPRMLATYADAGIPLVEGYGLTETSTALALSAPHANRPGTVGRALPGVRLRIADDGEVLAQGPNVFRGYLDAPELTAEAFVDGWFRTGDLGAIDADGFLSITGRKKHLLVTSTGKNVAPEPMENRLRARCGLEAIVLVGDRRPYLVALVLAAGNVDHDNLLDAVREANADVSPPERVRRIVVVDRAIDDGAGERTASGKIVRHVVLQRCADVVDAVYADAPTTASVLEVVARPEPAAAPQPVLAGAASDHSLPEAHHPTKENP